jgi:hypothetical protein
MLYNFFQISKNKIKTDQFSTNSRKNQLLTAGFVIFTPADTVNHKS